MERVNGTAVKAPAKLISSVICSSASAQGARKGRCASVNSGRRFINQIWHTDDPSFAGVCSFISDYLLYYWYKWFKKISDL
ncbi:hypothetical protein K439DRAFT_1192342 [Ramaria rubella]|nr:hypothetical protein K439DRAFT_1192342 [Ramaria rubella]